MYSILKPSITVLVGPVLSDTRKTLVLLLLGGPITAFLFVSQIVLGVMVLGLLEAMIINSLQTDKRKGGNGTP